MSFILDHIEPEGIEGMIGDENVLAYDTLEYVYIMIITVNFLNRFNINIQSKIVSSTPV